MEFPYSARMNDSQLSLWSFLSFPSFVASARLRLAMTLRVGDLGAVSGLDLSDINVLRWHPTQPHDLIHFDTNGNDTLVLQFTDVDTGQTSDVATLPGMARIYGNQSFDEVSRDGRRVGGMTARASDGASVVLAYDMIDRQFGALLPIDDLFPASCAPDPEWGVLEPDWVGVSPLGNSFEFSRTGKKAIRPLSTEYDS